MRDSEKPTQRFAYKEYISDEAKAYLADLDAKRKAAAAQLAAKS
jgi:pyruvate ferredoxin oxidoreductase beta subunit